MTLTQSISTTRRPYYCASSHASRGSSHSVVTANFAVCLPSSLSSGRTAATPARGTMAQKILCVPRRRCFFLTEFAPASTKWSVLLRKIGWKLSAAKILMICGGGFIDACCGCQMSACTDSSDVSVILRQLAENATDEPPSQIGCKIRKLWTEQKFFYLRSGLYWH